MFQERDAIRKNSLLLGAFALVTATLLATTYLSTKDQIDHAQRQVEQRALLEIIPMANHSNDLLMDTLPIPEQFWSTLGLPNGGELHIARNDQGQPSAIILPAIAPDGYSGAIKLIIGINFDGTIAGVRITDHSETPGLGDKVDLRKSDWVLSFNGKSLENPTATGWAVKKDRGEFDQFTGATITPRAVIHQVADALRYFAEDQDRLMAAALRSIEQPSAVEK